MQARIGWGLAEVFVDGPKYGDETVEAELSSVHFDDRGHGVQVGIRNRVDRGVDEFALVLSFWTQPGSARRHQRLRD